MTLLCRIVETYTGARRLRAQLRRNGAEQVRIIRSGEGWLVEWRARVPQ